ncbi:MAG: TerB family tellurite resistance protein [Hyphomicrobiaceae bacterium]|nr:TerB family tellurite resistance protein [Hyphomicrobiaceae bacterium]
MFDQLLRLLKGDAASEGSSKDDLRLAVAALLVEAARMDSSFGGEERDTISRLLAQRFELAEADVAALVAQADARIQDTVQYFPFTHNINTHMSAEEKVGVIEMLWRVAYADGRLDPEEDRLIRQIAGLIHVPDRDRMLARRRVLDEMGGGSA